LKIKSHSYKYLKYTPFGNTYTKDFALALIANENLGMDEHTDLLNISFSAPSYVNELFGPRSLEMEDLFIRLDRQIAHLLDFLDSRFGKDQVLVVLTSERGAADPYEFRKKKGLSTQKFNPDHGLTLLQSYLNLVYEPAEWITGYSNQQIYLNHGLIDRKGYDIERFQEKVARFMVNKSGVAYAVKSTTIQNSSYSEGMMMKIQNSFHPARSGDVHLMLEPGVIEIPERSGSIYSYDTHIPMMWWGNGFSPGLIHQRVNLRDVAPTISYLLNLPYPDASFGNPIIPLIEKEGE
ncbi:MAG TPA: alkaline phosphatase family protein, partial [Bacteroidales bacterium]|nr:alkaline phosphatase family protein [Bacteroidales bacterium]